MNIFEEKIAEYNAQQHSVDKHPSFKRLSNLSEVDIAKYNRHYQRFMSFAKNNIDRVGTCEEFSENMGLDKIITKTIYTEYGPIIATGCNSVNLMSFEGIYLLEIDGKKQLRYIDSELLTEDLKYLIVKDNNDQLVAFSRKDMSQYLEITKQISSYFKTKLGEADPIESDL